MARREKRPPSYGNTSSIPSRSGTESDTPLDRANDLVEQAYDAPSRRARVRLAKKAIEASADCVPAYVLLGDESDVPKQAAAIYSKGVAVGERLLGKSTLQRARNLWNRVDARPYLEARVGLAESLWLLGRDEEAIEHLWDILRLNKSDNQGVRYLLLSCLLERGEDAAAQQLLSRYPKDATASWHYGRALLAFRAEGDTDVAKELLAKALASNPYVPAYLLGGKSIPDELPDRIGFGDESEAMETASQQLDAWRQNPDALAWLQGACT